MISDQFGRWYKSKSIRRVQTNLKRKQSTWYNNIIIMIIDKINTYATKRNIRIIPRFFHNRGSRCMKIDNGKTKWMDWNDYPVMSTVSDWDQNWDDLDPDHDRTRSRLDPMSEWMTQFNSRFLCLAVHGYLVWRNNKLLWDSKVKLIVSCLNPKNSFNQHKKPIHNFVKFFVLLWRRFLSVLMKKNNEKQKKKLPKVSRRLCDACKRVENKKRLRITY